jgi:hypothetical protein
MKNCRPLRLLLFFSITKQAGKKNKKNRKKKKMERRARLAIKLNIIFGLESASR